MRVLPESVRELAAEIYARVIAEGCYGSEKEAREAISAAEIFERVWRECRRKLDDGERDAA